MTSCADGSDTTTLWANAGSSAATVSTRAQLGPPASNSPPLVGDTPPSSAPNGGPRPASDPSPPGASGPTLPEPIRVDDEGATEPACETGAVRCEGSLLAHCNAARTGFELVRDCRQPARCAEDVARCGGAACEEPELGCSLPELSQSSEGVHGVTVGLQHTCALHGAGAVRCWGRNQLGQLGYGHTSSIGDDEVPAAAGDVDVGEPVAQVVAGNSHTCVLLTTGAVRCWGNARAGRLGLGDTARREWLAELAGRTVDVGDDELVRDATEIDLGGATAQLAAGGDFTCALLTDGAVRCWGAAHDGQLGLPAHAQNIGDDEPPASVAAIDLGGPAAFIDAGATHTCALLRTGSVRCWGSGVRGKLGYGNADTIGDDETPASAGNVALGGRAIALSAGRNHTCAVLSDGSIRCWGNGTGRPLGYDDSDHLGDDELPTARPALDLGARAIQVAAGQSHTCALLESGAVRCWGSHTNGELGDPTTGRARSLSGAAHHVELGGPAREIAAHGDHGCAVLATHELVCWGSGWDGNLGYGNTRDVGDDEIPAVIGAVPVLALPAVVPAPPTPAPDAGVDPVPADSPLQAPRAPDAGHLALGAESLTTGDEHACVVLVGGAVRCWGDNSYGQLGYANSARVARVGDDELPAWLGNVDVGGPVLQVVAGTRHSCALLAGGEVRCWGDGRSGRLGHGDDVSIGDDETPAAAGNVALGAPAVQLAAGGASTCALLSQGVVRCWGTGSDGRLGVPASSLGANDVGDDELPTAVAPVDLGGPAVFIAGGLGHACAILAGGDVRCWGNNRTGQLGYGHRAVIGDDESPASAGNVALGGHAIQLSLGNAHSCALLSDRTLRCWGNNVFSQLGYPGPSLGDDELPTALPVLDLDLPVVQVAAGQAHTCALLEDGNVRCWGRNHMGQLGVASGSLTELSLQEAPSHVELGAAAVRIDAGGDYTCALLSNGDVTCWGDGAAGHLGYGNTNRIGDDETPASAGRVPIE